LGELFEEDLHFLQLGFAHRLGQQLPQSVHFLFGDRFEVVNLGWLGQELDFRNCSQQLDPFFLDCLFAINRTRSKKKKKNERIEPWILLQPQEKIHDNSGEGVVVILEQSEQNGTKIPVVVVEPRW
jgi:hypothetical protein